LQRLALALALAVARKTDGFDQPLYVDFEVEAGINLYCDPSEDWSEALGYVSFLWLESVINEHRNDRNAATDDYFELGADPVAFIQQTRRYPTATDDANTTFATLESSVDLGCEIRPRLDALEVAVHGTFAKCC
jgi:hypothetical protein